MTKKSYNRLLKDYPKKGERVSILTGEITVVATHDRMRKPINLGRAAMSHKEKMEAKRNGK